MSCTETKAPRISERNRRRREEIVTECKMNRNRISELQELILIYVKLTKHREGGKGRGLLFTHQFSLSCSSRKYTRYKISLLLSDAYRNQLIDCLMLAMELKKVYAPRLDDPRSKTFKRCLIDTYEISGVVMMVENQRSISVNEDRREDVALKEMVVRISREAQEQEHRIGESIQHYAWTTDDPIVATILEEKTI
ncbi:hypothetical protein G4B88_012546 [Cannabis sativa]|uniref:Uncharacterized protein n=1 Tax=Cannabis sativa TaxID=3483 RepID=A0A7J6EPK4_CANSA|nr:hypothetical protein G4B88_012546 [Cannabis sativa]